MRPLRVRTLYTETASRSLFLLRALLRYAEGPLTRPEARIGALEMTRSVISSAKRRLAPIRRAGREAAVLVHLVRSTRWT
jgi:hypothetical protein